MFYYFISIMDGYSRKILDWALCENMEGINIEPLVARVKEKYPETRARIIHDNGKQFISKDFKSLVSLLELYETAARVCHPQSNGKLERFHLTLSGFPTLSWPIKCYRRIFIHEILNFISNFSLNHTKTIIQKYGDFKLKFKYPYFLNIL